MKYAFVSKNIFLLLLTASIFFACNKDVEQFPDTGAPEPTPTGMGLADTIATMSQYSLYSSVIVKSGYAATLNDLTKTYTVFVPGNNAVKQAISVLTGGALPAAAPDENFVAFINSDNFTMATAVGIVGYNTVPQSVSFSALSGDFPNMQYPSILNPAPTLSALLRLTTFLGKSSASVNYVNNVPVVNAGIETANGMIYETGATVIPPSVSIMDRVNADPNLTYFKAAVAKADEGLTAEQLADPLTSVTGLLSSIGANLTVFAPTDFVFRATLVGLITLRLVQQGVPLALAQQQATALASSPEVFQNPAFSSVLDATTVKGLLYYHILGSRAFSVNFTTSDTNYSTLLSLGLANAPGLTIKATFAGPVATSLTVKGFANATPANVMMNPLPNGSSDQNCTNGVLHKIDQVLQPMSF